SELVGEKALCSTLANVSVPPAYIDETKVVAICHKTADSGGFALELIGGHCLPVCAIHFFDEIVLRHGVEFDTFGYNSAQVSVTIHRLDSTGIILGHNRLLARSSQIDVRNSVVASPDLWKVARKRDGSCAVFCENLSQPVQKTGSIAVVDFAGSAKFDTMLRVEMASG